MQTPNITVIGQNELFPHLRGDLICDEISPIPGNLHKLVLDKVEYIIQITSQQINGNEIFIDCYITNNSDAGRMIFKLTYV